MIFVREWGAEERHNAIAQHLVDGAFVAVHGVHHALQRGIEELLGGFGVEVGDQLHGAFEVGKQHGDLLAFAFQGAAGGEDFLREIGWGVGRVAPVEGGSADGTRAVRRRPSRRASRSVLIPGNLVRIEKFVLQGLQASSSR